MRHSKISGFASNKAISTIIGTLLILIIAIFLGGVFYSFTSGTLLSNQPRLEVGGVFEDSIYVKNIGSEPIREIKTFLEGNEIPAYIECTNVIFSDDFDDGDSDGWNVVDGDWNADLEYTGDSRFTGTAESYVDLDLKDATIEFDLKLGEERSVDVMLIIDRSSSMSGSKIQNAKAAAKTFVDQLDPSKDRSGLVTFDRNPSLNHPLTFDIDDVKTAIDAIVTGSGTNIGGGIDTANTELVSNGRQDAVKVEVLLSDGEPNQGSPTPSQYAKNKAQEAANNGIIIYTIGVGSGITQSAEDLLEDIASITGGKYYFSPDGSTLSGIYAEIAGEVTAGGSAGIILASDSKSIKIVLQEEEDSVQIEENGILIDSASLTVENNIPYKMKVVLYGKDIFFFVDGKGISNAELNAPLQNNMLSLFSSQTAAIFDNVKVSDNNFYAGHACNLNLFDFTDEKGTYLITLRLPSQSQQLAITR